MSNNITNDEKYRRFLFMVASEGARISMTNGNVQLIGIKLTSLKHIYDLALRSMLSQPPITFKVFLKNTQKSYSYAALGVLNLPLHNTGEGTNSSNKAFLPNINNLENYQRQLNEFLKKEKSNAAKLARAFRMAVMKSKRIKRSS